jgi:hypothetical protein
MGRQSDAHIGAVNSEITKLKKSIDDIQTAGDSFDKTWQTMMGQVNTGKTPTQYGTRLKTDYDTHETALGKARTAVTDTQSAIFSFEKFLNDKDGATINPLAKKSLARSRTFVRDAKTEVSDISTKLKQKQSLKNAYDHAKKYKYI